MATRIVGMINIATIFTDRLPVRHDIHLEMLLCFFENLS